MQNIGALSALGAVIAFIWSAIQFFVLVPRPLVARSSEDYRARFVETRRKIYAKSRGNPEGIQEICDSVKLVFIYNSPKFTYSEKNERLRLLFSPSQ